MANKLANQSTVPAGTFSSVLRAGRRRSEQVILPLPPAPSNEDTRFEMEVYARFMRHLRQVPNSRMEIKILSSIQFTADMLEIAEALVAKTLVDMGLRAPRKAFPIAFLEFYDKCLSRQSWGAGHEISGLPLAVAMLRQHWSGVRDDRFDLQTVQQPDVLNDGLYAN
ncbi:MAG TPA: hypothetical protein VIF12_02150 [Micavibrio sp.]|jgi:hypothetical protein